MSSTYTGNSRVIPSNSNWLTPFIKLRNFRAHKSSWYLTFTSTRFKTCTRQIIGRSTWGLNTRYTKTRDSYRMSTQCLLNITDKKIKMTSKQYLSNGHVLTKIREYRIRWWNAANSVKKFQLLKNLGQHPTDVDTSHHQYDTVLYQEFKRHILPR